MRLRSSSKHEPHLILSDDRRTPRLADWGPDSSPSMGPYSSRNRRYTETEIDKQVRQHLCGWACKCFLTRLNFLIAGCIFTLVLYVLSETTDVFESISKFFTGVTIATKAREEKSLEKFIDSHYTFLLLIVPCIIAAILTVHSLSHYSDELNTWCYCTRTSNRQINSASRQQTARLTK